MVIILSKTLEKKAVNDVRCTQSGRLLRKLHTMSRGTTLFSRGTVDADRWIGDMGRDCSVQRGPPRQPSGSGLERLWAPLPDPCQQKSGEGVGVGVGGGSGSTPVITSLIRDLSLADGGRRLAAASPPSQEPPAPSAPASTAAAAVAVAAAPPPIKRQCRSLSLSDEFVACRSSSWRPQGSRVWTAVEKRRCHSGGSVRPAAAAATAGPMAVPSPSASSLSSSGGHFPAIQRSFSFSLPSRSCVLSEGAGRGGRAPPCFAPGLAFQPLFTASPRSPNTPPPSLLLLRRREEEQQQEEQEEEEEEEEEHSLSHEHVSLSEAQTEEEEEDEDEEEEEEASDASSQDSTPELVRRRCGGGGGGVGGRGLSWSRSQPRELGDKKIGMKRRRPADAQEPRPSLDLAKMTQNLQTFQTLSSFGPTTPPGGTATTSTPGDGGGGGGTTTTTQNYQWSPCNPSFGTPGGRERSTFVCASGPGGVPEEWQRGTTAASTTTSVTTTATTMHQEDDWSWEGEEDSGVSACSVGSRSRASPPPPVDMEEEEEEEEEGEEEDTDPALWKGAFRVPRGRVAHLGGELDLDQIERN